MRRKPAFVDAFDAAVAEMERTIRGLRSSSREAQGQRGIDDANGLRRARENLQRLEEDLKQLAKNRDEAAENAEEWERRAMRSVHAENDELAREALQRKKQHERLHRLFSREHDHGVRVVDVLRELLESVEAGAERSGSAKPKERP